MTARRREYKRLDKMADREIQVEFIETLNAMAPHKLRSVMIATIAAHNGDKEGKSK